MRLSRKLVVLAAGIATAVAPSAVSTPATAAGAAVCQINGKAILSPGIGDTPKSGTYNFQGTTIACEGFVGTTPVAGTATATSSGTYSDTGAATGTFAGTFSTGTFTPVGGISCSGNVSGSRVGSTVTATLTGTCGGVSGSATVTLSFVPDPACTATVTGPPPHYNVTCAFMTGASVVTSIP